MTENKHRSAYPSVFSDGNSGLTKREYIAAMAMQGILAGVNREDNGGNGKMTVNDGWIDVVSVAKESITQADELLKQLNP